MCFAAAKIVQVRAKQKKTPQDFRLLCRAQPVLSKDSASESKEPSLLELFAERSLSEGAGPAAKLPGTVVKGTHYAKDKTTRHLEKTTRHLGKTTRHLGKDNSTLGKDDSALGKDNSALGKDNSTLGRDDSTSCKRHALRAV